MRPGGVWRGDVDHPPWHLQPAEARIEANTMTAPLGLELPEEAPVLHFARRMHPVHTWKLAAG